MAAMAYEDLTVVLSIAAMCVGGGPSKNAGIDPACSSKSRLKVAAFGFAFDFDFLVAGIWIPYASVEQRKI